MTTAIFCRWAFVPKICRIALLGLLVGLTACSNSGRSEVVLAPEGGQKLPSPKFLAKPGPPRETSYVEADLIKDGSEFDTMLPSSNVSSMAPLADYEPSLEPGDPISEAAFAIYRFNIPDYDRNPQIRHEWSTPPPEGELFFGLSNWTKDRWEWFAAEPDAPRNVPPLPPYINAGGDMLLVVMRTGTSVSSLTKLRIGSEPPAISAATQDLNGFVPLSPSIDVSASSDPDGDIVNFEWDLDGDGVFETNSGLDAVQTLEIQAPQSFVVGVRATDNDGVSAERSYTVRAFEEWQHSWGGDAVEVGAGVEYDGASYIYVAGTTESFGAGSADIVLLKFDLAGELIWQHTWGTSNTEAAIGLDIGADGGIYVLGNRWSPFVVKFNSRGEAQWARWFPDLASSGLATGLTVDGDDVYFCGHKLVSTDYRPYLVRLTSDGETVWTRRAGDGEAFLNGLTTQRQLFSSTTVLAVGHKEGDAFVMRLDEDTGDLLSARTWHSPSGYTWAQTVVATGPLNPQVWIGGYESSSGSFKALMLAYGNSPVARVWDAGTTQDDEEHGYGVALLNGQVILGGHTTSFGAPLDGMLLRFATNGTFQSGSRLTRSGMSCSFEADLEALAGTALASAGTCNASAGTTWLSTSGSVDSRTANWEDVSMTLDSLPVTGLELAGNRGTPGSAVLDSGGGGTDCLVAVRRQP